METEPEMLNEGSAQAQGFERVDSQESTRVLPGRRDT